MRVGPLSALETLHLGQLTLSPQLIKPNYLVIPPTDAATASLPTLPLLNHLSKKILSPAYIILHCRYHLIFKVCWWASMPLLHARFSASINQTQTDMVIRKDTKYFSINVFVSSPKGMTKSRLHSQQLIGKWTLAVLPQKRRNEYQTYKFIYSWLVDCYMWNSRRFWKNDHCNLLLTQLLWSVYTQCFTVSWIFCMPYNHHIKGSSIKILFKLETFWNS